MLNRIRILQVGDVHLPSAAREGRALDEKDKRFPVALKNIVARAPLKTVFRRMYELISEQKVDSITFMGDFTDYGDEDGYASCARYIAQALQVGSQGIHKTLPVGIVPGNHDISRPLALEEGATKKFGPIIRALGAVGLPPAPIAKSIRMELSDAGATMSIFLMNSCWGCGEPEYIPEGFRERIIGAINSTLSGADAEEARRLYYDRQLDTPAFSEESITSLVQGIQETPCSIAVLVAHHNLLPQRLTRLAPYTELVNSGALRSSLLELPAPILYLHGHIHDEPIEIVRRDKGYPLVAISAPEAVKGFNVIEVSYTRSGIPLSVKIAPYRFDGAGVLKSNQPIFIELLGHRRRSSTPTLAAFYAKLLERRESYWSTIVDLSSALDASVSGDELIEMLELLAADGSVFIENYDLPNENWIVRAEI